jgi:hypothetical protein
MKVTLSIYIFAPNETLLMKCCIEMNDVILEMNKGFLLQIWNLKDADGTPKNNYLNSYLVKNPH